MNYNLIYVLCGISALVINVAKDPDFFKHLKGGATLIVIAIIIGLGPISLTIAIWYGIFGKSDDTKQAGAVWILLKSFWFELRNSHRVHLT